MAQEITLTTEGFEALKAELEQLKGEGRKEVAEKIKVALSFGDLSENSEYDEAKNEQGKLESRINELEEMIQNVRIIDEADLTTKMVRVGSKVKIKRVGSDDVFVYQIVGFTQANPDEGLISDESPVGKALLGKKRGNKIDVEVPAGVVSFEILEISK